MNKNIKKYIEDLRIIDGHEHIDMFEIRKERNVDFFKLIHYMESDMITAGMERDILYGNLSDEKKAEEFLKYQEKTKNTTYSQVIKQAVEDLYGMDQWTVEGILELNKMVKQKTSDPSWFKEVLSEKSKIDLVITLAQTTDVDFSLFKPVLFLDFLFRINEKKEIENIGKKAQMTVYSFSEYIAAVEKVIENLVDEGMIAMKLGHAYWRSLSTDRPSFHEAESVFNSLIQNDGKDFLAQENLKPFQDYIIHFIIQKSIKFDLPIQIHTGHHETSVSRDGNIIPNSKVSLLIPLFLEYMDAKFVLLHNGIPYHQEYLSIVKNYPNTYADFTWSYIISPTLTKQILHQTIEMIPMSKVLGFGGDFMNVEGAYAHQKLARQIIGEVLTEKIETGMLTEEEACSYASAILRENYIELYKLDL